MPSIITYQIHIHAELSNSWWGTHDTPWTPAQSKQNANKWMGYIYTNDLVVHTQIHRPHGIYLVIHCFDVFVLIESVHLVYLLCVSNGM